MKINLKDYCCQGVDREVETVTITHEQLSIPVEGTSCKTLVFSPLGNRPSHPIIALIGVTPGSQADLFRRLLQSGKSPDEAAHIAAFSSGQDEIKAILRAHGFAERLGLDLDAYPSLNDNPNILTTSVMKCSIQDSGDYRFASPDLIKLAPARHCARKRLLPDLKAHTQTLRAAVVFGDDAWAMMQQMMIGESTLGQTIEELGIKLFHMPHFSTCTQRRDIYKQPANMVDAFIEQKALQGKLSFPRYRPKADAMRAAVCDALDSICSSP
ncbi:hypothetical protein [uncultured Photobacterium sp.]|uniref:uracil-DNA glycosylase family protein n=1 Tax=uncultured Photobacterium sp. TaxID=173973 RepID=UPI002602AFD9|nr:hypothetical protein [uncultured Photobacterium sp.]